MVSYVFANDYVVCNYLPCITSKFVFMIFLFFTLLKYYTVIKKIHDVFITEYSTIFIKKYTKKCSN